MLDTSRDTILAQFEGAWTIPSKLSRDRKTLFASQSLAYVV